MVIEMLWHVLQPFLMAFLRLTIDVLSAGKLLDNTLLAVSCFPIPVVTHPGSSFTAAKVIGPTMGFDVATFQFILESGFEMRWNCFRVPRADAPSVATPRVSRRSLDAAGALGLALHFLNSTMQDVSLMEIFALTPSTVSRYVNFSLQILVSSLRKVKDEQVHWPQGEEFDELSDLAVVRHPLLQGAFGTLDGLNLPVQTSSNDEVENSTYNGWLHAHFVSSVLAFSASGACKLTLFSLLVFTQFQVLSLHAV
jgi:hypothetical protein